MSDLERITEAMFGGRIPEGMMSVAYAFERGTKPISHFLGWRFEEGTTNSVEFSDSDVPYPDVFVIINPLADQNTVIEDLKVIENEMAGVGSTGTDFLFLTVEGAKTLQLQGALSMDFGWPSYMGLAEVMGEDGSLNPFPLPGKNIFTAIMPTGRIKDLSKLCRPIRMMIERKGLHVGHITTPRGWQDIAFKNGEPIIGDLRTTL